MSHYFVNDSNVKSDKRNLYFDFKGIGFKFVSDNGVFSKNEIDEGSEILLESYVDNGRVGRVLDVGAGVGVIGITVSKINDCEVDMLEINKRAVDLCEENIIINKISKCRVFESDIYEKADGMYDVVISNPPIRAGKAVIYKMFEDSLKHLKENGALFIVIKKSLGANSAIKKLQELFKHVEVLEKDKGYYIIKSFN